MSDSCDDEKYDYDQEVANTGFGDMLLDKERNDKYEEAIKHVINSLILEGKEVRVLDIGTGTGIFAMMAARAGAHKVYACERFRPMANCAQEVLKANKLEDRITLIAKSSENIKIPEDMEERANVLVAELLDTELIGEGLIKTYNHALEHLLTPDVICIPAKARVFVQVANTSLAVSWHRLKVIPNDETDKKIKPYFEIVTCPGSRSLIDMHLTSLPSCAVMNISKPHLAFTFDFHKPIERTGYVELMVDVGGSCVVNSVIFYWDLFLDPESKIHLTCEPQWGKKRTASWREHWTQALYFLPKTTHTHGASYLLQCAHDEFSFWFGAAKNKPPACYCGLHIANSPIRLGQMNNMKRNKIYMKAIGASLNEMAENQDIRVLVLGDCSLVGLFFAWSKQVQHIYYYLEQKYSRDFMQRLVNHNKFMDKITVMSNLRPLASIWPKLTHVFAEPYWQLEFPWQNLKFEQILFQHRSLLSDNVKLSPSALRIFAMPMEFDDLYKLFAKVGNVNGFDMTPFDQMVQASRDRIQYMETHGMWEYKGRALAKPHIIHEYVVGNWKNYNDISSFEGSIPILKSGTLHGLVLWAEWKIDEAGRYWSSGGPTKPVELDSDIEWDLNERQGVHFMRSPVQVDDSSKITYKVIHEPKKNDIQFEFTA